jgi:hypothetical protein
VPAVDLAAVGQLKQALTNLLSRAVHFIEEEAHRLLTRGHKPVRSVPRGSLATVDLGVCRVRQTKEITLSHLRRAALDDRKTTSLRDLIDHLRLADTVATTEKHGQACVKDVRDDGREGCEIDRHVILLGGVSLTYLVSIPEVEVKVNRFIVK